MRVFDVRSEPVGDDRELSCRLTMDRLDVATIGGDRGGRGLRLWIRGPADAMTDDDPPDASPFLAALVATAMWWNEPLDIEGSVSPRLLGSAAELVRAYASIYRWLTPVEVSATDTAAPPAGEGATASLFSRGADSWHTALFGLGRGDLVYTPSIDRARTRPAIEEELARTKRAADDLERRLLVVHTNLRGYTERFQTWNITHGGVLAGIGIALGRRIGRLVVPSTAPDSALTPTGNDPSIMRWCNTERTDIVFDHTDDMRWQRVVRIARDPRVRGNLTVCHSFDAAGNCGRCEKCLDTALALHVAGEDPIAYCFARDVTWLAIVSAKGPTAWPASLHFIQQFSEVRRALGATRHRAWWAALTIPLARARWAARLHSPSASRPTASGV